MLQSIQSTLSSPMALGYILFILLGVSFVVLGLLGRSIEKRISIIGERVKNQKAKGFIDNLLDGFSFITKSEDKLNTRLNILEIKTDARAITKSKIVFGIVGVAVGIYLKNYLATVPIVLILTSIPTSLIDYKVRKRLELYDEQILDAFQLFVTEFTTTKSVQNTLTNITPKLKYPIRREFERLGLQLNSGSNPETSFLEFADRTQNKWTMIFSQMLITYFETGFDFIDQLLDMTSSITNERVLKQQNNTELSTMRLSNMAMNALVPVAYFSNKLMNPQGARVFVDTSGGRTIMFLVTVAVFVSLYIGKKITDY